MSVPPEADRPESKPRFLIDQNVQDAVRRFLADLGYETQLTRLVSGADAPDNVIAFAASQEGLVLISHDKDFRHFAQFFPEGRRRQFRKGTGQILLRVPENQAATQLRQEWERIEFEYRLAQRQGIRLQVRITDSGIVVITNAKNIGTVE